MDARICSTTISTPPLPLFVTVTVPLEKVMLMLDASEIALVIRLDAEPHARIYLPIEFVAYPAIVSSQMAYTDMLNVAEALGAIVTMGLLCASSIHGPKVPEIYVRMNDLPRLPGDAAYSAVKCWVK